MALCNLKAKKTQTFMISASRQKKKTLSSVKIRENNMDVFSAIQTSLNIHKPS